MADRYWVGGTDTWNSTAGTKWATTSGGAGGAAVPTTSDDVYFDANSTGTCTISGNRSCRNLDETGHAGVLSHGSGAVLTVAGSLTLTSAYVAVSSFTEIIFTATSTGQTITTAGNQMGDLTFQGVGGGWTLQDSITGFTIGTYCDLNLISGSLNLNNQSIANYRFNISGTSARSLTMGSSVITNCLGWYATTTTNLTFDSGTSSISVNHSEFYGGSLTYYDVQIIVGSAYDSCNIQGINTYTNLTFKSYSPIGKVYLSASQIITGVFLSHVNDSVSNDPDRVNILVNPTNIQNTITAASISASTEYTNFRYIIGAGAADWDLSGIAGGCGDLGNNSGITFSTPITAYYYQNTGNFYDKTKWFLASGGTGGAARIPLPQDTARFDASSCNAGGQTITLNHQWLPTLDFTGSNNNEAISFGSFGFPDIHGSFTLESGMTISGGLTGFTFRGHGETPIFTTNGVSITKDVVFGSELTSATISGNYSSTGDLSIICPLTTTGTVSCVDISVTSAGSFTPGGNVTQTGTLSTSGTAAITSSAYTFSGATTATFSSTGTVNLLGLTTSSTVTLTSGTLTIGASGVSCSAFSSSNSNTRVLNMGSGTWDITGTGTCWNCATTTGLTINPSTSTIKLSNTSATTKTFDGGSGKTYNDLYIDGAASNGTVTINKANTYNKITIEPYASIIWKKSLTHTFSELLCLGASGQVITFATDTAGTQATLSCPTGKVINGDYLNIRDSVATGGALFYAGDNSTNTSNNTGWTFTAQPDLDNVVPLQSYLLNELTPNVGGLQNPLHAYSFTEYAPEISTGAFLVTPLQNYTLNNYVPTVISGGGVEVPLKEFTLNEYSPTIMLVNVPLSALDIEFHTMSIASGASADTPLTEFGFDGYAPLISISANVFAPLKTFDIQFYSTDQLVTVPRRSFLITSGIEVFSGSATSIPLETFAFTSYIPTFIGEQLVHNVPITDFAELTFLSYTPEIASGKNIFVPVTAFEITSGISYYSIQLVTCTGEPAPIQHIEDSKKLTADAYIDLFEIVLAGGGTKLYLKMNQSVDWQGNTYEGTGIKIEGVGTYSDDEVSRPKLTIFNPENVFSYLVDQGLLENAKVVRIRVLKEHIDDDLPIYRRQQWFVKRVASVRRGFIGLELRDMLDGQNFLTPGRMFIPPEFPMVSLQ